MTNQTRVVPTEPVMGQWEDFCKVFPVPFDQFVTAYKAMLAAAPSPAPKDALGCVLAELKRAQAKFPTWPTDPLHALAVLGEEFGELTKDVLQMTYEPSKSDAEAVRKEAVQTAAMALRFIMSLDTYIYKAGEQHQQARHHRRTNNP